MKRILSVVSIYLIFSLIFTGISSAENRWNVRWYKIDENTHEFKEFIGEENWTAGNFEYNWLNDYVYDGIRDYIGFVAETKIYCNGGEYEFKLYEIDEEVALYLDGKEIMNTTDYMEEVRVNISEGMHTLKIEWKEYCCLASIGFSADEKIFVERDFDKNFTFEIILLISLILILAFIVFKFYERKEL